MYALMMYGIAALMILFIATITAGIILGTIVGLVSIVRNLWHADRVATPASTRAQSEHSIPEGVS